MNKPQSILKRIIPHWFLNILQLLSIFKKQFIYSNYQENAKRAQNCIITGRFHVQL
jgi:hypothetical protein